MGKRSRKRRDAGEAPAVVTRERPTRASRSEAKNAAVRAQLEPLEPGERPLPVTIGAVVAFLAGATNFIAYVAGEDIQGKRPALAGILIFTGLMMMMAWGLWKARYWAVLGLQALLGLLIVILSVIVVKAANVVSALILVALILGAGSLFWFNVRAMARIQMPQRPR